MDKYQLKARPVVIRRELLDHYSDLGLSTTRFSHFA